MFDTPILFTIFIKENTSLSVFEEIRKQQPKKLYIFADGPRADKQGEDRKTENLRKKIIEKIDWECNLKANFKTENLGCGKAMYSAITWFFENEEAGIILEDDCLPHSDFFPYCETMLKMYAKDPTVAGVAGWNFYEHSQKFSNGSYFFSGGIFIWGWATWRRVWECYQYDLPVDTKGKILPTNIHMSLYERNCLEYQAWLQRKQFVSTWDTQFLAMQIKRQMRAIIPVKSLISNIGFGEGGIHCTNTNDPLAKVKVFSMLPIIHPTISENPDIVREKLFIQLRNIDTPFLWRNSMGIRLRRFKRKLFRYFSI